MTNRAAQTATGPMSIVAAEQHYPAGQRLIHDEVAHHLLPPGVRWVVSLTAWPPARNLLFNLSEKRAPGLYGSVVKERLFRFGMEPEQVPSFLREYGWQEVEQLGCQECTERYLKPNRREIPVSEIERIVYAERA